MAMLSSPVLILLYAMMPLVDADGSTPSVLTELAGVLMVMPQTLKPIVRSMHDVELRRVLQGHARQHEAVARPHPDHARRHQVALVGVLEVPPVLRAADDELAAASVEGPGPHDRGVRRADDVDERVAIAVAPGQSALVGRAVEVARVARPEQRDAVVQPQRDAGPEKQAAGQERRVVAVGHEAHRLTRGAGVEGSLDGHRVQGRFVGGNPVGHGLGRHHRGARRRGEHRRRPDRVARSGRQHRAVRASGPASVVIVIPPAPIATPPVPVVMSMPASLPA